MTSSILQFGTSRFLQAHADLILSEARSAGMDVGTVTVVETTGSPQSKARARAFSQGKPFPVKIRGLQNGQRIDEVRMVAGVTDGLSAREDMDRLCKAFRSARYVLSNTGDRGFDVPESPLVTKDGWRSYPELLAFLLFDRFSTTAEPLAVMPCELVSRNGDMLRDIVLALAAHVDGGGAFEQWIRDECQFVNSLVDRIVSEPLSPLGAVAEPYALWALEARPGFAPPCEHPQITVTPDLEWVASKKLFLLNLAHTILAQHWIEAGRQPDLLVRQILEDPAILSGLDGLMRREVIPAFAPHAEDAARYWEICLERFANPFLDHRLSDIAVNHEVKVARRGAGLVDWARARGVSPDRFVELRAALPSLSA